MSNPKVRQALSLAIDRTELVNRLIFAKPATSIVNAPITGVNTDTVISTTANMPEAKKLVEGMSGSFNITVKKGKTKAINCHVWLKDKKVVGTAKKVTVKVISGESNVKVSGLKVKGKKKGTAKLKLTVNSNSSIASKTIKVTVKK